MLLQGEWGAVDRGAARWRCLLRNGACPTKSMKVVMAIATNSPKRGCVWPFSMSDGMLLRRWRRFVDYCIPHQVPQGLTGRAQGTYYYMPSRPQPLAGDLRIQWTSTTVSTISVLAKQQGSSPGAASFEKWSSEYDKDYGLFEAVEGM